MRAAALLLTLGFGLVPSTSIPADGTALEPSEAVMAYAAQPPRTPSPDALRAIQSVTSAAFIAMPPSPAALPIRLVADRLFSVAPEIPEPVEVSSKDLACLATAIYFEARGESVEGQTAVAQVILNRVRAKAFPDTVCDVVYQGKNRRTGCQFSFTCDGKSKRIREQKAWTVAERIAGETLSGQADLDGLSVATHYHATYVSPRWARSMRRLAKIGHHIFYEERGHTFLTASR